MDRLTRFTLRADAAFDAGFGLLTFFAPWLDPVFNALELPNPKPEIFTQLTGGLLVAFAYLLWSAPASPALARPVALAVGLVNLAGALLVGAWLLSGALGTGLIGTVLLTAAALALLFFALGELRYVRSVGR